MKEEQFLVSKEIETRDGNQIVLFWVLKIVLSLIISIGFFIFFSLSSQIVTKQETQMTEKITLPSIKVYSVYKMNFKFDYEFRSNNRIIRSGHSYDVESIIINIFQEMKLGDVLVIYMSPNQTENNVYRRIVNIEINGNSSISKMATKSFPYTSMHSGYIYVQENRLQSNLFEPFKTETVYTIEILPISPAVGLYNGGISLQLGSLKTVVSNIPTFSVAEELRKLPDAFAYAGLITLLICWVFKRIDTSCKDTHHHLDDYPIETSKKDFENLSNIVSMLNMRVEQLEKANTK